MTEPTFRAISGTRYASGHLSTVHDVGGSLTRAPEGWADHVRHIEVDALNRDPSGCLVCNTIARRESVEDPYSSWTPEQRRLLYMGQLRLDEPEDRPRGGDCD